MYCAQAMTKKENKLGLPGAKDVDGVLIEEVL